MSVFDELLQAIQPDMARIERSLNEDMDAWAPEMDPYLTEIVSYGVFSGGKRIRPLLTVISARLCGAGNEDIYKVAIALEYLHLATLFHDDVIDNAEIRRGKASVVKKFGLDGAILTGDFLHARAMDMVGRYGGIGSLEILCKATRSLVNGEFVQLRNIAKSTQTEEDYFKAIYGKTASLISAAVRIGGLLGGASNEQAQALLQYGEGMGYAFQIIDDILDFTGDPGKTGKAVGNDLAEGKMTLPLIYALEAADDESRETFLSIFSDGEARASRFEEVRNIVYRYDGFTRARRRAEQCVEDALRALAGAFDNKWQEEDRNILTGIAAYILNREK